MTKTGRFLMHVITSLWFLQAMLPNPAFSGLASAQAEPKATRISWTFTPAGSTKSFDVLEGFPLAPQIGTTVGCCDGMYRGTVPTRPVATTEGQLAILLPQTTGLKRLDLNGRVVPLLGSDYSSVAPLIVLEPEDLKLKTISIHAYIQGTAASSYSGMWQGRTRIGPLQQLVSDRDLWLVHQRIVPMFTAAVFFFFACMILWLRAKTNRVDPIYLDLIYTLLTFGVFYLYLAGIIRHWFPRGGTVTHIAMRALAQVFLLKLLCNQIGFDRNKTKRWAASFAALIPIVLFADVTDHRVLALAIHSIIILAIIPVLYLLFRWKKGDQRHLLRWTALIAAMGHISDLAKLWCSEFQIDYPLIYLNRYTSPPVVLTALVYLTFRWAREINADIRSKALEEAALQAVHDIQSPLAALRLAAIATEKSESNELISVASIRIREIVRSLSTMSDESSGDFINATTILRAILDEKRLHFKDRNSISIEGNFDSLTDTVEILVNPALFGRVLSNLINNAVEAIPTEGRITLTAASHGRQVSIKLSDSGRGIAPDQLKTLGKRGFSFGKSAGSGLGIYNAKKTLEKWGASFTLTSTPGVGTEVSIVLPVAARE